MAQKRGCRRVGRVTVSRIGRKVSLQFEAARLEKVFIRKPSRSDTNSPRLRTVLDSLRDGDAFTFPGMAGPARV